MAQGLTKKAAAKTSTKKSPGKVTPQANGNVSESKNIFTLYKLPPELRNEIYRQVLVSTTPIEVKRIGLRGENRLNTQSTCTCKDTTYCRTCRKAWMMRRYTIEARTLTMTGKKTRKLVHKRVTGGELIRVDRQTFSEAAAILYGETTFRFDSYGRIAFECFCMKVGGLGAMLQRVVFKDGFIPLRCDSIFKALHPDAKLRLLKFPQPWSDTVSLQPTLTMLLPMLLKAGTEGCTCSLANGECTCQTDAQKRLLDAVDLKAYDNYARWDGEFVESLDRSANALLELGWKAEIALLSAPGYQESAKAKFKRRRNNRISAD